MFADACATARDIAAVLQPRAIAMPFGKISPRSSPSTVPRLELNAIIGKLVHGGRGGYCYEQNSLLQAVLIALGFRVTALLARVRSGCPRRGYYGPQPHDLVLVDLPEGPHLIDAGFGNMTLTAPLALTPNRVQSTPHEDFRLIEAAGDFMLQARLGDTWADVYRFDLSPQLAPDIAAQNWHTATRQNALFAHNLIVTRTIPAGRHVLFNTTLTWRPVGQPPERRPLGRRSRTRTSASTKHFSLRLPPAEPQAAARGLAAATEPRSPWSRAFPNALPLSRKDLRRALAALAVQEIRECLVQAYIMIALALRARPLVARAGYSAGEIPYFLAPSTTTVSATTGSM